MAGNRDELCNKLALARPAEPETALTRLQRWKLMDTVPDWLLPKLSAAFVTKNPSSKEYIGFLITDTDEVLVVGDNTNGILALDPSKVKAVARPRFNKELSGKGIIDIVSMTSNCTIVARTSDGKIFTWGQNTTGQLGLGHANVTLGCSQVKGVLTEERVVQHCCGGADALCLTSSGKIVGWGLNVFQNISGPAPAYYSPFVITWPSPAPIVTWIGSTDKCFFALTASGEVYSWGGNHQGRAVSNNAFIPTKVQLPPEVSVMKVSCGLNHVLFLTTKNELYSWGANNVGQVGNEKEDGAVVALPQLIKLDELVEDILAVTSANVSFCVTSAIHLWGSFKGGRAFMPIPTTLNSFDCALIANDVGMSSVWTRSLSPAEVESRYRAVITSSNQKKLVFSVNGTNIEAWEFAACRSPVLRRILEKDWKDQKPIELRDISKGSLFLSLMMFLHTDEVMATDVDLLDLVRLANRYEVFELGRKSAKKLQVTITESNAVDIYEVAKKCGSTGLVLVVLDTISSFSGEVGAKSDKKYDQTLLDQLDSDLKDFKTD